MTWRTSVSTCHRSEATIRIVVGHRREPHIDADDAAQANIDGVVLEASSDDQAAVSRIDSISWVPRSSPLRVRLKRASLKERNAACGDPYL